MNSFAHHATEVQVSEEIQEVKYDLSTDSVTAPGVVNHTDSTHISTSVK